MNNELLIFCTCAERDFGKYSRRVEEWAEQFKTADADLLCVCDGEAHREISGVEMVSLSPALGRPSIDSSIFPGWKRSFAEGIRRGLSYPFMAHVENDVKILNIERFLAVCKSGGIFSGYSEKYGFCESALLILNDREKRIRLADEFSDVEKLYADERAEHIIQRIASPQYVFIGERIEGHPERERPGFDYLAQI